MNIRDWLREQRQLCQFILLLIIVGVLGLTIGLGEYQGNDVSSRITHEDNVTSQVGNLLGVKDAAVMEPSLHKETMSIDSEIKRNLISEYAILVDCETGRILLDKYATERMYPASMTKLMTILVAMDQITNLQEEFIFTSENFTELEDKNASTAGFVEGERVRMIDLMYGAILPSGAECSLALAQRVAGSEEAFVRLMNEKAKELGMEHTHFTNCTGLHEESHYSTVYDIAILLQAVLEQDTLRQIISAKQYEISPTNKHEEGVTLSHSIYVKGEPFDGKEKMIAGGKTGYTDEAGLCLASFSEINQREYILVTAAANGDSRTRQNNIYDAITIYETIHNTGEK